MSKTFNDTGMGRIIAWISAHVFKKSEAVTVQVLGIDSTPSNNSSNLVTSGGVYTTLSGKEDVSNKVTSLSSSSTNTQYPSAKCVYDELTDIEEITAAALSDLDDRVLTLESSGFATASDLAGKQDVIDSSHKLDYSLLSNTPTIPTVPTISTNITTDGNDDTKTASPKAVKTFVEGKGYGTYSKPSGGIPASDLASGVIPTVPTISTNIVTDKASDAKTASPKAVYNEIHPAKGSSQPSGGFVANTMYVLGTITGSVTFSLATPSDSNIVNHYYWTFDTSSTAPTITWPSGLSWYGGSAPTVSASKHYEISVMNNVAISMEV